MAVKRQNWMQVADREFAKYIKERDQTCRLRLPACESPRYLQCAHLISRSYKSIRTNPANAVTACRSCHKVMTHRPLEWQAWIELEFGPHHYFQLRAQALSYVRVDWRAEAAYWKAINEGALT